MHSGKCPWISLTISNLVNIGGWRQVTSVDNYPVGTQRNDNVIITPKRRFDVMMTLLLRCVSIG